MSRSTGWVLDIAKLAEAVDTVRRYRGMSDRAIARETGLCSSTMTRLRHGQKPDADGLVSLLVWLNADARQFVKDRDDEPTTHLPGDADAH